jgi:KUP system potassium uptake protein
VARLLVDAGRDIEKRAAPATPRRVSPGPRVALALAALGVVFGDIGTSPLYAIQTVFSIDGGGVGPTDANVYGVISLIFWAITLIVTGKYVGFVMRADNEGEGGIMALTALVQRAVASRAVRGGGLIGLGILGASLFYGDGVITPAISVVSAVEGLEVVSPGLQRAVVPIALAVLTGLFALQRRGTERVGGLFGPVMVVWFAALAATGAGEAVRDPAILEGLSPTYAVAFVAEHPVTAFIAMGAVVLAITGAEALYADLGHFGGAPIRRAWFGLVFPALTLNYLGQGALLLDDPAAKANPFYLLLPGPLRIPMIVLATAATVIASQAVVSGVFSISRQAVQLGFLPRLTIRHTSRHEIGQVYLPAVNWGLLVAVAAVMLAFGSAARLATAYGVAVTGTFLVTTVLFLVLARGTWDWPLWKLVAAAVGFGGVEVIFFAANLTKILHGGWLPLLTATGVFTVLTSWRRGRRIVTAHRAAQEGSLQELIDALRRGRLAPVVRVPGTAIYPTSTPETAPLALRAGVRHSHVLHDTVVILTAEFVHAPHVPPDERVRVANLGHRDDGIIHVTARFGFQDHPDLPAALRHPALDRAERAVDVDHASWFLSRVTLALGDDPGMARWRRRLFIALAHNAASAADYFRLPDERTVVVSSRVSV